MSVFYLAPIANSQVVDDTGIPLVGGYWSVFNAGTSTPAACYTDNTGATAQATNILLDASGRPASPIWMVAGVPLKFRLYDALGVALLTIDNVSGINDANASGFVTTTVVNNYTKTQYVTPVTVTNVANTYTHVSTNSNTAKLTLTANSTLENPTALADGMVLNFIIKQDSTGGWTLAYGTKFKSKNGAGLTISSGASTVNLVSCVYDADNDILICAIVPGAS